MAEKIIRAISTYADECHHAASNTAVEVLRKCRVLSGADRTNQKCRNKCDFEGRSGGIFCNYGRGIGMAWRYESSWKRRCVG